MEVLRDNEGVMEMSIAFLLWFSSILIEWFIKAIPCCSTMVSSEMILTIAFHFCIDDTLLPKEISLVTE